MRWEVVGLHLAMSTRLVARWVSRMVVLDDDGETMLGRGRPGRRRGGGCEIAEEEVVLKA